MFMRTPRRAAVAIVTIGLLLGMPLSALASHLFTDVPTDHTFHDDIEAIAFAGVTTGCGGGKFCPEDPVTRGQMAAFLNRLGALAPGKTPVVNARTLDGYLPGDLVRLGGTSSSGGTVITETRAQVGSAVNVTAPSAGWVVVTASTTVQNNGVGGTTCTAGCNVTARVKHDQTGALSSESITTLPSVATAYGSLSNTYRFQVEAGSHAFSTQLQRSSGNGTLNYWSMSMTAVFSPFGA